MSDLISRSALIRELEKNCITFGPGVCYTKTETLKKLIEDAPGVGTVYGYNVRELVLFAEMCRRQNVTGLDLKTCAHDAEWIYAFVVDAVREAQARWIKEALHWEETP